MLLYKSIAVPSIVELEGRQFVIAEKKKEKILRAGFYSLLCTQPPFFIIKSNLHLLGKILMKN